MHGPISNQAHIGAIDMNHQRGGALAFSGQHGGRIAQCIKVKCRKNS
jgi:hypothetical protein